MQRFKFNLAIINVWDGCLLAYPSKADAAGCSQLNSSRIWSWQQASRIRAEQQALIMLAITCNLEETGQKSLSTPFVQIARRLDMDDANRLSTIAAEIGQLYNEILEHRGLLKTYLRSGRTRDLVRKKRAFTLSDNGSRIWREGSKRFKQSSKHLWSPTILRRLTSRVR